MTETKKTEFAELAERAFKREILKKLVFSRPISSEISKVSGRLCAHRGRRILSFEYSLPQNTVKQKNIPEADVKNEILSLISEYRQANLITSLGDAEYKISDKGNEVLLGCDKLKRKLSDNSLGFESAIEELDRKKNYILSGDEPFLKALDISDKNGRIHDKKQGKFRQINRFLEHIDEIYSHLPSEGVLNVYDLCSGKSYLSFAVYHYLTSIKKREVRMLGIDLKRDVMALCADIAKELSFDGMRFVSDDIRNTPKDITPDLVISLHACDTATDTVIDTAIELGASVILSTPCCHNYLNSRINSNDLSFVTDNPHLRNKLCEAVTDALRILRLKKNGYDASATELTDPENTPKNTLIRAIKKPDGRKSDIDKASLEYELALSRILGENANSYLQDI
jgi:hypothetical protein